MRTKLLFLLLFSLSFFYSCKHGAEVSKKGKAIPVSGLEYNPASLELKSGTSGRSVKPSIQGTLPVSFSFTSVPDHPDAISIDGEGVITAKANLPEGEYSINVTATNSEGAVTFPDVYHITATQQVNPPSGLDYSVDTLFVNEGDSAITAPPVISGTSPMTFVLASSPADNHISVKNQGEVKVGVGLPVGVYKISITASNTAGSQSFPDALVVKVLPVKPSALVYSPNFINIVTGNNGSSSVPEIKGSKPISYSITSVPATAEITIDPSGKIKVSDGLAPGTYLLTVSVTNASGITSFDNIFTVNVSSIADKPSNLVYSPNTATITQRETVTSVVPSVDGATPMAFVIKNPSVPEITINAQTGRITTTSSLAPGTYSVDVIATNAIGSSEFTNVYSIIVNPAIAPAGLTYSPNSFTVTKGTSGSSALPVITGDQPITYALSVSPATSEVTINPSNGIISFTSNLPAGNYSISVNATNVAGTTAFPNSYTIVVNNPPVTFTGDIKPLIISKCTPCHTTTGGRLTNYTLYENSSTNINMILQRVQLTPGSAGYMPMNRPSLSEDEINLLKQWKQQGLLE